MMITVVTMATNDQEDEEENNDKNNSNTPYSTFHGLLFAHKLALAWKLEEKDVYKQHAWQSTNTVTLSIVVQRNSSVINFDGVKSLSTF